jgi:hypothetical protein
MHEFRENDWKCPHCGKRISKPEWSHLHNSRLRLPALWEIPAPPTPKGWYEGLFLSLWHFFHCISIICKDYRRFDKREKMRLPVDRRKAHSLDYPLNGGAERRSGKERRSPAERRSGWVANSARSPH